MVTGMDTVCSYNPEGSWESRPGDEEGHLGYHILFFIVCLFQSGKTLFNSESSRFSRL